MEIQPTEVQSNQVPPKKNSPVFVGFLLVVILGLTAMNVLQNRVIQRQRTEIAWLMSQGVTVHVAPPQPAAPAGGEVPAAKPDN
jgi:hypothetical protein